jgi:nucleoside-diphosphate-sugar epimerase
MKRYVVTGGAGFIGSALVRTLLAQDAGAVRVVDNFLTGRESNLSEIRSRIELDQSDIRDYSAVAAAIRGADIVFHLAAIPSVPRSIQDPEPSHQVNIDGTFNVLRAAAQAKVQRVVYAASSSAYGDTEVLPKVESMPPRPKSPYAVQKLAGEYYTSVFHSCFDLETVALRFFNVFGERQDPSSPYSGVLSLFFKALIERRSPTIFGDGEQTRDFCYIDNTVRANLLAASSPKKLAGEVVNIAGGRRIGLNELCREIGRVMGHEVAVDHVAPRAGDIRHSLADISAAHDLLGYEPLVRWEDGLAPTLAYLRALRS